MRAVPLGEPGLSFRYERTFGQPLVPYLVDNAHLFRPGGVATDAKGNVYITENNGQRMIKYTLRGGVSDGRWTGWCLARRRFRPSRVA